MMKAIRRQLSMLLVVVLLAAILCAAEHRSQQLLLTKDNSKSTNVGNLALTITNYGVIGNGFSKWPQQSSMQYPQGSGIEHLFIGGLWVGVGSSTPGGRRVTTAAFDASSITTGVMSGFEFTTDVNSTVTERSALPQSPLFDPNATSPQDFLADFTDVNTADPNNGDATIPEHNPIGIDVHFESYAWNYWFADNFVILNYWIKNVSGVRLDSVYVGMYTDLVVRNTNVTPPTVGASFYNKSAVGFVDSVNMAYAYDYDGDGGLADSYSAVKFLGSFPFLDQSNYQCWQFRNSSDPVFFSPQTDSAKYEKMMTGLTSEQIDVIPKPSNFMSLLSVGPFVKIAAGDSINVVFAMIAAKKKSSLPTTDDSFEQKIHLFEAAQWAQRAYNGEDHNGNGIQDPNETWTKNGKPRRYILPTPPNAPRVKAVPGNTSVDIYWDNSSEASVDLTSFLKDFEGYRIYCSIAGVDSISSQDVISKMTVYGEFDRLDDTVGRNTGFDSIRLAQPFRFPADTVTYRYKYTIRGLLNGKQYAIAVTAFDSGDPTNGFPSIESSLLQTLCRVVPDSTSVNLTGSQKALMPGIFALLQNYPNPFNPATVISYQLPVNSHVTLKVYDLLGREVAVLVNEKKEAGRYSVQWDATKMSSGVYFYTLQAGEYRDTKRMLLLK